MNGPAVAEQAGWQSRRVGRLPASASAYAALIEVLAAVAALAALSDGIPAGYEWWRAALLLPLAAVGPMFRVAVGRNHSLHAAPAFVVAGTLVLPPALLVPLVLVMLVPQWLRDRYAWYIGLFNVANYMLSTLAAWAAVDLVRTDTDLGFAAAGLAAAVVFVAVNHLLLAVMLRLGRGHSFRQSGLFSATGLTMELVLAALGIAIGASVLFNPWILPVLIAPLALAHRSLSTVALLRESEERSRTMFAAAPTAIMLFDRTGRILSANRSAESLFGYSEQEMIGKLPTTFRHPDDADNGDEAFGQLIRGERDSYRREASFVTKSGATVVAHLATALVRDADGKPAYVIGMAEDVTEQRQLEEQLRQSQKLEAIGRLAGGVAHDFNNMLTAIGGYTALALEQAETGSTLRGDLDEIRKATDRAALLTRQLLAFSRKQVLIPELLNLNDVVLELEAMLRPLLGEDVTLTMQLDPGLGPIEADPGQLHQVVMNLVVNASDAMPKGGGITIATANCDVGENDDSIEPGHYVTLAVRDTGEGIDEQTLRQIFEPFFTTKDAGKGTGTRARHGLRHRQADGWLCRRRERAWHRLRLHDLPAPRRRARPAAGRARACTGRRRARRRGRDGVDPGARRRGRGRDPRPGRPGAARRGLRGAARCGRGRGDRAGRQQPRRRAPDRPDHAGNRRARARRPAARGRAGAEGDVHVRLRRGQRLLDDRPAPGDRILGEAVHLHDAERTDARAGRPSFELEFHVTTFTFDRHMPERHGRRRPAQTPEGSLRSRLGFTSALERGSARWPPPAPERVHLRRMGGDPLERIRARANP